MSERAIIEPVPTPDSEAFWKAASDGRFLVKRCADCDRAYWYPRPICPLCGGSSTSWIDATGRGTIYTFSIMSPTKEPYAIAYVALSEGPIMMTNIVDCDFDALAVGMPVRLRFVRTPGGFALPCFVPAPREEAAT